MKKFTDLLVRKNSPIWTYNRITTFLTNNKRNMPRLNLCKSITMTLLLKNIILIKGLDNRLLKIKTNTLLTLPLHTLPLHTLPWLIVLRDIRISFRRILMALNKFKEKPKHHILIFIMNRKMEINYLKELFLMILDTI